MSIIYSQQGFNNLNSCKNKKLKHSNTKILSFRSANSVLKNDVFIKNESFNKNYNTDRAFSSLLKHILSPVLPSNGALSFTGNLKPNLSLTPEMFKVTMPANCIQNFAEFHQALTILPRCEAIKIGRATDNQLIITNKFISRNHLTIARGHDGQLYVADHGSANGTYINDSLLEKKNGFYLLQTGDSVAISNKCGFDVNAEDIYRKPLTPVSISNHPQLGPITNFKMLEEGSIYIGRLNSENSICISDDNEISRKHAMLEKINDDIYITDNNSSNGTYVNRKQISGRVKLNHNDKILLGNTIYVYNQRENQFLSYVKDARKFYEFFPVSLDNLNFRQSSKIGDCYLLAAIKAMAENPDASRYMANMINKEENGDITVSLFGARQIIKFKAEEVKDILNDPGVHGQQGLKLIERAYGRLIKPLRKQNHPDENRTLALMKGGYSATALDVLIPCKADIIVWDQILNADALYPLMKDSLEKILSEFEQKSQNMILCAATRYIPEEKGMEHRKILAKYNKMDIAQSHAYTIKKVDSTQQTITILNPWYSNVPETLKYDDFFKYFGQLHLARLQKPLLEHFSPS
jgi:pSer/pThr/pTyr-binding forkhead associated (FHA) protein